jgi:A/G-specific adenine glycosylase
MSSFSKTLLRWYPDHRRDMPWVGETDPYKVWLSEVILQQTRVEQGTAYYLKFIKRYPTVHHLAKAPATEVMKMWEGLGYYSRARNMHATAQLIDNTLQGKFPDTLESLTALKGIGKYTAYAILSYAYRKPYAVTDGNVLRIISRYKGITEPVNTPSAKAQIEQIAEKLLDKTQPHLYNQAMMDFGAQVCTPRKPNCPDCPFKRSCYAFQNDATDILPKKEKKKALKERYFYFFIMRHRKKVLIHPRHASDIWKQLWQFPLIETSSAESIQDICRSNVYTDWGLGNIPWEDSGQFRQQLTHQRLICKFYVADVSSIPDIDSMQKMTSMDEISKYAFPGVIRDFLKGKQYF